MTNREWLNALTDEQLAAFLTDGLLCTMCEVRQFIGPVSLKTIKWRDIRSVDAVTKWLKSEQEFMLYDEYNKFA